MADYVTNKCQGLLGILARATPHLPKELLKLIYTALIRSHMEYCSSIFSSTGQNTSQETWRHRKKSCTYHIQSTTWCPCRYTTLVSLAGWSLSSE